jgi:hypothetical protein
MEINIMGPDGICISPEAFSTKSDTISFYKEWVKRFENQGYYSSVEGRISLEMLDQCSTLIIGNELEHKEIATMDVVLLITSIINLP